MELPDCNSKYSRKDYWEERFAVEKEFNWLGGLSHYVDVLDDMLSSFYKSDSILQLGCGNSSFSTELSAHGWTNITNMDISLNGLNRLREREPRSEYLLMDMTRMPIKDHSFDIVIEKATLDSLLVTAKSPWNFQSEENLLVSKVLSEVKRILRPGGTFISITFTQPHFRVPILTTKGLDWSVRVDTVESSGLPSYVMQMTAGDPKPALDKYCWVHSIEEKVNDSADLIISSEDEDFLGNIDPNSDSDYENDNDVSR